jgi:hypothetical protein
VAIAVAVIGAAGAVLASTLKKSDDAKATPVGPSPSIVQSSNGANSPNVSNVTGNVTIRINDLANSVPQKEPPMAGDHIRACEKAHGMRQTREHRRSEVTENVSKTVYMACEWPAPAYAEADGFSSIEVSEEYQEQYQYSASDCNYIDIVHGPCEKYTLSYDYGHMGYEHRPPFAASPGQLLNAFNGKPCDNMVCCNWGSQGDNPDDHGPGIYHYPADGEVFVMRNDHIGLGDIRCER